MKPRIIIFATAYFPLIGGAEIAMQEITVRLPDWQFDLFCARLVPGLADREQIGNVIVHRLGFGHPIDKYLLPFFGPWMALRTVNYQAPILVWSLMASYGGLAGFIFKWLRPKTKILLSLQEGDPLEHYAKRAGRLAFIHRRIFEQADAVQAISTFLASWAKSMGFKGHPKIIPNGVDVARFSQRFTPERRVELRRELGFADTDVVVVTVSRLALKNGIDDLIRALTYLPLNYKVLIVGEGEEHGRLVALTRELALPSRVVFCGAKSREALPEILQSADIFCRPSLSEGLGSAFLEAMAAGLPIIGTAVGGVPDFLKSGDTGVFCRPRDPESVAAAVKRIQTEPGLRDKLIRQGEALVREGYSWDELAKQIDVLLHSLAT